MLILIKTNNMLSTKYKPRKSGSKILNAKSNSKRTYKKFSKF